MASPVWCLRPPKASGAHQGRELPVSGGGHRGHRLDWRCRRARATAHSQQGWGQDRERPIKPGALSPCVSQDASQGLILPAETGYRQGSETQLGPPAARALGQLCAVIGSKHKPSASNRY